MAYQKETLDFFQLVYQVVRLVPKGRVTTYGHIAKALGARRSSRIVGWAMNNAHGEKPNVPAHRVVNRNGLLTGKHHFGKPDKMQKLLEKEGVEIEGDQVQNFKELLWDPMEEINI